MIMIETEESKTKTLDIPTQNNSVSDDSEIDDADDDDISIPFDYDITSFGADFPVDALVRHMNNGNIIVPTFGEYVSIDSGVVCFQRNLVWSKPKSDRFIESLPIGLPVPGIFLVCASAFFTKKAEAPKIVDKVQRICIDIDGLS